MTKKAITLNVLTMSFFTAITMHAQILNVPVSQAALTIPHKAHVSGSEMVNPSASSSAGAVSLVLRLYSQQSGGAPLFEERQTVPVQSGSYLAFIGSATQGGIPASIYNGHGTFWIEAVTASSPSGAATRVPFTLRRDASTPSAPGSDSITLAVDSSVCFTCGSAWPVFSGMIPSAGGHATERAGGCGGSLVYSTDSSPFICSR